MFGGVRVLKIYREFLILAALVGAGPSFSQDSTSPPSHRAEKAHCWDWMEVQNHKVRVSLFFFFLFFFKRSS